jgi:pSer/pThr/pTyr-binding forkhead associated (FHA) protein
MSWDSRATVRRPGNAPSRGAGMYIVYVGLTESAEGDGLDRPTSMRVGDSFRLLPGAAITFGRSELCEVTIPSQQLSRAHALISFVPGNGAELLLVDLGSRNGTWVDGRGAPVQRIQPGAEFTLARAYRFRVQPAVSSSS